MYLWRILPIVFQSKYCPKANIISDLMYLCKCGWSDIYKNEDSRPSAIFFERHLATKPCWIFKSGTRASVFPHTFSFLCIYLRPVNGASRRQRWIFHSVTHLKIIIRFAMIAVNFHNYSTGKKAIAVKILTTH